MSVRRNSEDTSAPQLQLSLKIYEVLRHYEAPILHLQRLLVWDNYLYSSIFVALAHLCFIYFFVRCNHFFGIFFTLVLILVWIDMWKHKIWPEIRAIAPDIDSEWGELNPRLLSVREMCDKIAQLAFNVKSFGLYMLAMRKLQPGKFCLRICGFCLVMMIIGEKIPGAFVMYACLLLGLVVPVCYYHRLTEKLHVHFKPFLEQFQLAFRQKPGNTYQIAQSIASENFLTTANDNDIEDFVPMLNESDAAELAKALSEEAGLSEAEEEHSHDLPEVAEMLNRNQNNNEKFWNTHTDSDSDYSDGDNFGPPLSIPLQASAPPQNMVIGASVVENLIKEVVPTVTHAIQRPLLNIYPSLPPKADSKSSTPTSDFEFVIFDSENEED